MRNEQMVNNDQKTQELAEVFRKKYSKVCIQMQKPNKTKKVYKKSRHFHGYTTDCWVCEDALFLLTAPSFVNKRISFSIEYNSKLEPFNQIVFQKIIPLSQIHHFQREGEVYTETKVSGGSGGGSSIAGAVVGGLIAGGVGAIIGSRKPTESIKSETIRHDSREVILYYYETPTSKALTELHFDKESYEGFMLTIPDKEFSVVVSKELDMKSAEKQHTASPTDQIRELSKLKDEGIITDEEFAEKKKELLAKI